MLLNKSFYFPFRTCVKFGILLFAAQAAAWGPQGHRVAGAMTWEYLSPALRARVTALIGDESLARASTWADRMRDNPSRFWQQEAGPYHYVTVPSGKTYAEVGAPTKGDSVTALREFRAILRDPNASRAMQQLALRFSLHIIQDLHQPMHVGNGRDRGGNDVALLLGGRRTNLHRVWDTPVPGYAGLNDSRWLAAHGRPDSELVEQWRDADPEVWIRESAELRDRVYPGGDEIGVDYLATWSPVANRRLQQSAIRCAAWLESALSGQ